MLDNTHTFETFFLTSSLKEMNLSKGTQGKFNTLKVCLGLIYIKKFTFLAKRFNIRITQEIVFGLQLYQLIKIF